MKIKQLNSGDFIMHINGLDICWEVVDLLPSEGDKIHIRMRPWNLGYTGRPWLVTELSIVYTFLCKIEDLRDWRLLDVEIMCIPRLVSGIPPEAL